MVLMMLMFLIVISTASPLLNSVMEEKMTRISEVLLGSLSPFELMAGKLLGVIGVSIVLSTIYLSGAYAFAVYHGYGDAVTIVPDRLVRRLPRAGDADLRLAVHRHRRRRHRSEGRAGADDARACCSSCRRSSSGCRSCGRRASTLAVVSSLVPFATPVLMTLRMALTPAPTPWQIALGFVLTLADDRLLRLGRRPHLPRRHPDAGQERDVRRDVALGARRLIAPTDHSAGRRVICTLTICQRPFRFA